MDYNNSDVIIARATPVGNAALGIIRISGPNILSRPNIKMILTLKTQLKLGPYLFQQLEPPTTALNY